MTDRSHAAHADALLYDVFPWRATVEVERAGSFVSVRYRAEEADESGATLFFERDPGDRTAWVSWNELEAATETGRLNLEGTVVRQPEVEDLRLLASPFGDFLGEQSKSDDAWTARMRLHQSWWRSLRLRVPPGAGPTKRSTVARGSMLDTEAAEAGLNFLSPEAHESYLARESTGAAGVDPWRTTRNLLASQPMAFNLFGYLSAHLDLATALFADLLAEEVGEVTSIEIKRLSDALGDRTAFDAFATYLRPDGSPGCLAIETKLTEPFSQKAYAWNQYLAHPAVTREVWATDDPVQLGDRRWSQLFRNHLLAEAETAALPHLGRRTVLVVHHRLDPHCTANVDGYRQLLVNHDSVRAVDIGTIASALVPHIRTDDDAKWLARFEDRYINLELSERLVDLA